MRPRGRRNREGRRVEGLTDAVIHVADASAIGGDSLDDDDFMAIRNDAHKGLTRWKKKKASSRSRGTIAKNGIRHERKISRDL